MVVCRRKRAARRGRGARPLARAGLSRFRSDSEVSRLNRARTIISPLLAAVARLATHFRAATGGAFDPTLGAALAQLGYDRSFELLAFGRTPPLRATPLTGPARVVASEASPFSESTTRIIVDDDRIDLDGPGDIDFGGLAKGFTVDVVVGLLLRRGARALLVDGGGDIRGVGPSYYIGAGDGLVVDTRAGAIATSSTRARRWYGPSGHERHHILDPRTRLPASSTIETVTVVATDAVTADALATAMIANPEVVTPRLASFGAHALVRARDGRWWTTPGAPFMAAPAPRHAEAVG